MGVSALPGLPGRDDLDDRLGHRPALHPPDTTPRAGRLHRRPGRAHLWLLAVGRDQGGRGRAPTPGHRRLGGPDPGERRPDQELSSPGRGCLRNARCQRLRRRRVGPRGAHLGRRLLALDLGASARLAPAGRTGGGRGGVGGPGHQVRQRGDGEQLPHLLQRAGKPGPPGAPASAPRRLADGRLPDRSPQRRPDYVSAHSGPAHRPGDRRRRLLAGALVDPAAGCPRRRGRGRRSLQGRFAVDSGQGLCHRLPHVPARGPARGRSAD